MYNQLLLVSLGFVLGTYFGASLMALMAIAKRPDPVEVELER